MDIYNTSFSIEEELEQIKDIIWINFQDDWKFQTKLVIKNHKFDYNNELIKILKNPKIYYGIKDLIIDSLWETNINELINFLWKNSNLFTYFSKKTKQETYDYLKIYYLNYNEYWNYFLDYLIDISPHIRKIDDNLINILTDNNFDFLTKKSLCYKLFLSKIDIEKVIWIIDDEFINLIKNNLEDKNLKHEDKSVKNEDKNISIPDEIKNNLWDITTDNDKKAVIFYLRYDDILSEYNQIIIDVIKNLKFKILSWNSWFEKIIITFRFFQNYDANLNDLISDWNSVIKFAFVKWNDFKKLINSPNRHLIHLTNWTPEELLINENWKSIINNAIFKRFKLNNIWESNFVYLDWNANTKKTYEDLYYVKTLLESIEKIDTNPIIKKFDEILSQ